MGGQKNLKKGESKSFEQLCGGMAKKFRRPKKTVPNVKH